MVYVGLASVITESRVSTRNFNSVCREGLLEAHAPLPDILSPEPGKKNLTPLLYGPFAVRTFKRIHTNTLSKHHFSRVHQLFPAGRRR